MSRTRNRGTTDLVATRYEAAVNTARELAPAVEWPPGTGVTTCISSASQDTGPPLMNRPPSATSDFDGN